LNAFRTQIKAWLTLLRVPNLFSVPGDPLAGYALTAAAVGAFHWPEVWPCLLASLCFYIAGLLSNDYFDIEEDKRERPERPLPSGVVRPQTVFLVAFILSLLGLILAALPGPRSSCAAFVLIALVWVYNVAAKHDPVWGPTVMGACRGTSLLMGAGAIPFEGVLLVPPLLAALGLALYTAGMTRIAKHETRQARLGAIRWMPATVMLLTVSGFVFLRWSDFEIMPVLGNPSLIVALLGAMAVLWTLVTTLTLSGTVAPQTVSRAVGALIRGLLFLQALLYMTGLPEYPVPAYALLGGWAVSGWLSRWFYGS
jgi:heme O synthase-like polyprenyltransferase